MSSQEKSFETDAENGRDPGVMEDAWFENGEEEEISSFSWHRRSPLLSAVLILVCFYLAWSWRDDLVYSFYNAPPTDLGNAIGFTRPDLPPNVLVSIKAIRNPNRIAKLNAWFTDFYFAGIMGTDQVFIVTTPEDEKTLKPMEGLTNQLYSGRLLRLGDLSYYAKIREFSVMWFGDAPDPDSFVIEQGKTPPAYRWVWGVYLALLLVVAVNVLKLVRRFKKS